MVTSNVDMRDAFFDSLYEYVSSDKNVIILTADHGAFGLNKIREEFPEQYLNTGASEQNAISVAAGLASSGKKVYVYAINNFVSMRVLEQINIDICSQNLDVNIVGVGAGFTYSTDGPTHQGLQDMSVMSNLPNMEVYNVTDEFSTIEIVNISYLKKSPKYLRIEKGILPKLYNSKSFSNTGISNLIESESDYIVISTGYMTQICKKSIDRMRKGGGLFPGLFDMYKISPIDQDALYEVCKGKKVIIVEENLRSGGIGEKITSILKLKNHSHACDVFAVKDGFYFKFETSRDNIHKKLNMDASGIYRKIASFIERF